MLELGSEFSEAMTRAIIEWSEEEVCVTFHEQDRSLRDFLLRPEQAEVMAVEYRASGGTAKRIRLAIDNYILAFDRPVA